MGARIIGHDLGAERGHVAVLATDESGYEYLCDLGDKWLKPILVSPAHPDFSADWHDGYFPQRQVRVERNEQRLTVYYRRGNGKEAQQSYELRHVPQAEVSTACDHSQQLLRHPFVEHFAAHPELGGQAKWEFDRWRSFWMTYNGPAFEPDCDSDAAWGERIAAMTGMSASIASLALGIYRARG